jgi:hypothetical protein
VTRILALAAFLLACGVLAAPSARAGDARRIVGARRDRAPSVVRPVPVVPPRRLPRRWCPAPILWPGAELPLPPLEQEDPGLWDEDAQEDAGSVLVDEVVPAAAAPEAPGSVATDPTAPEADRGSPDWEARQAAALGRLLQR